MTEPRPPASHGVTHAMSVDVEEYFHAWALSPVVTRADWDRLPSRVEASTDRILQLFDRAGVKATFFMLGWVGRRQPSIVRAIVDAGHELASHGFAHDKIANLDHDAFYDDVRTTRLLLEDLGGVPVHGYRAPSFSIGPEQWWAYDLLHEAGYTYSSSVNPVVHDHYGVPTAPRHPFRPSASSLVEIPVATLDLGRRVSCAGGGWFRLLPCWWSLWCLRRYARQELRPATFFFHPWEIDPDQPRIPGLPLRSRVRHYVNLPAMETKLARLLAGFRWSRIDELFDLAAPDLPLWQPPVSTATTTDARQYALAGVRAADSPGVRFDCTDCTPPRADAAGRSPHDRSVVRALRRSDQRTIRRVHQR